MRLPRQLASYVRRPAWLSFSRGAGKRPAAPQPGSNGRSVRSGIDFKRAVGIHVEDTEVWVALVAQTLRGAQLRQARRFSLREGTENGGEPKYRVMVVDDNPVDREVARRLILKRDFEVVTATDGWDALDRLKSTPVDVIVTDLMMPRLDGMGLLKELERVDNRPPVIVMSAYGNMDAEISTAVNVARHGAHAYIGKPVDPNQLFEAIQKCLAEPGNARLQEATAKLPELVATCCGSKPPKRAAMGIPTTAVFFASFRAPAAATAEISTDSLLSAELRGAVFDSKDLCADWMSVEVGKTPCVLLAATRSERVKASLEPFANGPVSPQRFEPEGWAALRASWTYQPPLSRRGLEARFLVGPTGGLAILAYGHYPLTWRSIQWDPQRAQELLLGAFRGLETYARQRLGLGPVQHIVIQGLGGDAGATELTLDGVSAPVLQAKGPPYNGELIAFGLGLGALETGRPALNLARSLQQPTTIAQMFPKGEAAFVASLIFCLTMILQFHVWDLEKTLARLKLHTSQVKWARTMTVNQLQQERSNLLTQMKPLGTFMIGQVLWTPYLAELPGMLPDKIWLIRLHFGDYIWARNEQRDMGDRFMLLRGMARFPEHGAVPPEVDATLKTLQDSPLITKTFPIVKLADIMQHKEAKETQAAFDILCVPKGASKGGGQKSDSKPAAKE